MPQFKTGNMFEQAYGEVDIILVTTNRDINAKGELVMGRGAAAEAVKKVPQIAHTLALHLKELPMMYGVVICDYPGPVNYGAFQVKNHWYEHADLTIIGNSVIELHRLARGYWNNLNISLNYPGIGNGKLKEANVRPLLECLPNNVSIWKLNPYEEYVRAKDLQRKGK